MAIKIIRREVFSPLVLEWVLKRFEREAKALAKLSHPNIVHVHDYGKYRGAGSAEERADRGKISALAMGQALGAEGPCTERGSRAGAKADGIPGDAGCPEDCCGRP